jgi:hypothetical protein
MTARLSALSAGRLLPPGRFLVLISVRGFSRTQGHSAVGRNSLNEKSNNLIGNWPRGLPACGIEPQPSILPRTSQPNCWRSGQDPIPEPPKYKSRELHLLFCPDCTTRYHLQQTYTKSSSQGISSYGPRRLVTHHKIYHQTLAWAIYVHIFKTNFPRNHFNIVFPCTHEHIYSKWIYLYPSTQQFM